MCFHKIPLFYFFTLNAPGPINEKAKLKIIKKFKGVYGGKNKNFHDKAGQAPTNPIINKATVANRK